MTLLDQARRALTDLALRAEWLEDAQPNGTPRPYRPPVLTIEAREAADAAARAERHERVDTAPGDSPDPFSFEIMELRTDLLMLVDAMAEQITQTAGVDRLPDASWDSDPQPYIEASSRWLLQAAEVDPDLPRNVLRKASQYVQRADAVLGNVTDGQTLDAPCFVCGSRDERHPTGGGRTLRVRWQHYQHGHAEPCTDYCRLMVVCEGGMCSPTSAQSGYTHRGMPAWDLATEYPMLVRELGVEKDQTPTCEMCGATLKGRRKNTCSDACRQAAYRERLVARVEGAA